MRARRSPTLLLVVLAVLAAGSAGAAVVGVVAVGTALPASAATSVTPQISAGNEHTCALRSDGTVWCWGRNQYGELGDGTLIDRPNPVEVVGLTGVTRISVGGDHTCAVLADSTVRCWGEGFRGQLGNGGTTDSPTPVAVKGLTGVTLTGVTRIAAGGLHTCAALADGSAQCWGINDYGQIGAGTTGGQQLNPTQVSGLTAGSGVRDVTTGSAHSCALLADGTARCWGFGHNGRLGNGTTSDTNVPLEVLASGSTQGNDTLGGITAIDAGGSHTCALVTGNSGTVRCWGLNSSRQLGDNGTTDLLNPFAAGVTATASGGITAVSAGGSHTCDVLGNDLATCWGRGEEGQLGDGTTVTDGVPGSVSAFDGIAAISSGSMHTCAIMLDDTVRCWGSGASGRLGDGETVSRATPVTVLASGTAATSGPAFSVRVAAAPATAPAPSVAVACSPAVPVVGDVVTCTVTGGDPEIDILWRAAYNPVIAEAGVTLDASGRGEFSFTVPAAALGQPVSVELVAWIAPVSLGVVVASAGGPVPAAVPAGDGGVAVAVSAPGMAAATTVAGLLTLLLATRVRPRRAHRP